MITLDINTNYSDRGGGIRTYHQAKTSWFNRQRKHRYYLVVPGPRHSVRRIGPRCVRIEVYGVPVACGYRFMLDYLRVWLLIGRLQPAVVEAGDPFLTGLACLLMRRTGRMRGWLTAFYHSDPIETWVVPWAKRGGMGRRLLARLAGRLFYRLQRAYDATVVTSRAMQEHLSARGVDRVVRRPFGSDPVFFQARPAIAQSTALQPTGFQTATPASRPRRLLFVGRLVQDKAAELLWAALPRLLSLPGVELTVLGTGLYERQFAEAGYPNLHYLGYIGGRREMAEVYRQHDILLAPGPYETFGLAVLEAMASGLVVVGPDRGGTSELLAEMQSPFVFPAGDLEGFVQTTVAAVAADLAPHAKVAQRAARSYGSWDDAIARLIDYYAELSTTAPPLPHASRRAA